MKKLFSLLVVLVFIGFSISQQNLEDISTNKAAGTDSLYAWEFNRIVLYLQNIVDSLNALGGLNYVLLTDVGDTIRFYISELPPDSLAQAGAGSGQVLKWDGSKWAPANDLTGTGGAENADSLSHDGRHVTGDSLITDNEGSVRFQAYNVTLDSLSKLSITDSGWVALDRNGNFVTNRIYGSSTLGIIIAETDEYGGGGAMLIAGINASDVQKGVASFTAVDFDVSSGSVSLDTSTVGGKLYTALSSRLENSEVGSVVQAYDAQLADVADGTFTGDFINTAYPWADNEVANDITINNASDVDTAGTKIAIALGARVENAEYDTKLASATADEIIADFLGTMVTGNTETLISVDYQDADNTIDFIVSAGAADSSWDVAQIGELQGVTGSKVTLTDTLEIGTGGVISGFADITNLDSLETDSLVINTFLALPAGIIDDNDIAAAAIDGGSAGEIADGSIDANDLAADAVSASELNATGVESELEAVLDLASLQGELTPDNIQANAQTDEWVLSYETTGDSLQWKAAGAGDMLAANYDDSLSSTKSDEIIQDLVGAMFGGNTETGIAVDYQDADGTIDLVITESDPTVDTDDEIIAIVNASPATQIGVPAGGSGAGTFTDGGILLGSGTGAFTALGAASNGQIPIGDGTTDPVLATLTAAGEVIVTNGAGEITVSKRDTLTYQWGLLDTVIVQALPGWKMPYAVTVIKVSAYTNANTTTFNIEERASATPNIAGTNMFDADMVAVSTSLDSTSFTNPTFAKDTWMVPDISATGDVAIFSIVVVYVKD